MIKNVVFDIGNVLAGFVWQDFFKSFGFSQEICERIADATVRDPFWSEVDRGVLSDEELLAGFIKRDPEIEGEIRQVFQDKSHMLIRYDYAIPWIRELKNQGYGVYYISNFGRQSHIQCSQVLDFLPEMDGGILSYQDQLIKPSPEIYRLFLKRYGLKAEECVFIDDREENVQGAINVGMQGIVFKTYEQASNELKQILAECNYSEPCR